MTIDISKIKPGDEVTVRLKVRDMSRAGVGAAVKGLSGAVWFAADEIVSHTPRELQVGDRCRDEVMCAECRVVAIHEAKAWVTFGADHSDALVNLSDLERIP